MTVQQFQAENIRRSAANLAHFVATTKPDFLDYTLVLGDDAGLSRSIIEQVAECVQVNRAITALLTGDVERMKALRAAPLETFADAAAMQQSLVESAEALASVVEALPDDALESRFAHWRGQLKGSLVIEIPSRNMIYHSGQVNYIQCLSGDAEFHLPPRWTE